MRSIVLSQRKERDGLLEKVFLPRDYQMEAESHGARHAVTRCQARCDKQRSYYVFNDEREASLPGASLFLFSAQEPSSVCSVGTYSIAIGP